MVQVQIPQLGQTKLEVTIEDWMVAEGDHVNKGDPLYELSNEKLSQEIESPATGTVVKIMVQKGGKVNPGDFIAEIQED